MKTYALFTMVCWSVYASSSGKIINGYEKDIATALSSLHHLKKLPPDKSVIKRLAAVEEYILYYEFTKTILQQFRLISPSLYSQIDTIVDLKGRGVDVYLKFVPSTKSIAGTIATTNIDRLQDDDHAYTSEYGPQTVSIHILAVKHSLRILAHEFGHVAYQVPNLAAYTAFFSRNYPDQHAKAAYLGHKPNDPSGQQAQAFENKFKEDLIQYLRKTQIQRENPISIRDRLAKMVRDMK